MRQVDGHNLPNGGWPCTHHYHAVRQLDSLIDIVRHENDRAAFCFPDAQQLTPHGQPCYGIQSAEGFVEEQHVWIDGERPGYFQTLLHASGKICRIAFFKTEEADHSDVVRNALLPFGARQSRESEADITLYGKPRENPTFLKNKDAARVRTAYVFAIDTYCAARRRKKAGHGIQQRRLSASGGTKQADKFACHHLKIDVVEDGSELAIPVEHHADACSVELWYGRCFVQRHASSA